MNLIERCENFLMEFNIPVTVFCRKIQLSPQSFYDWKKQKLHLCESTQNRIDEYLRKYNF